MSERTARPAAMVQRLRWIASIREFGVGWRVCASTTRLRLRSADLPIVAGPARARHGWWPVRAEPRRKPGHHGWGTFAPALFFRSTVDSDSTTISLADIKYYDALALPTRKAEQPFRTSLRCFPPAQPSEGAIRLFFPMWDMLEAFLLIILHAIGVWCYPRARSSTVHEVSMIRNLRTCKKLIHTWIYLNAETKGGVFSEQ